MVLLRELALLRTSCPAHAALTETAYSSILDLNAPKIQFHCPTNLCRSAQILLVGLLVALYLRGPLQKVGWHCFCGAMALKSALTNHVFSSAQLHYCR